MWRKLTIFLIISLSLYLIHPTLSSPIILSEKDLSLPHSLSTISLHPGDTVLYIPSYSPLHLSYVIYKRGLDVQSQEDTFHADIDVKEGIPENKCNSLLFDDKNAPDLPGISQDRSLPFGGILETYRQFGVISNNAMYTCSASVRPCASHSYIPSPVTYREIMNKCVCNVRLRPYASSCLRVRIHTDNITLSLSSSYDPTFGLALLAGLILIIILPRLIKSVVVFVLSGGIIGVTVFLTLPLILVYNTTPSVFRKFLLLPMVASSYVAYVTPSLSWFMGTMYDWYLSILSTQEFQWALIASFFIGCFVSFIFKDTSMARNSQVASAVILKVVGIIVSITYLGSHIFIRLLLVLIILWLDYHPMLLFSFLYYITFGVSRHILSLVTGTLRTSDEEVDAVSPAQYQYPVLSPAQYDEMGRRYTTHSLLALQDSLRQNPENVYRIRHRGKPRLMHFIDHGVVSNDIQNGSDTDDNIDDSDENE